MTASNTQSNAATGFANGRASNAAAHKRDLDKKYIVKHWLQPGHVGMLAAPPAHGKTAIVAALYANLALGHSFADLNVRRTAIYYLAPEDPVGVKDRAYPCLSGAPAATTDFYVVDKTPDFLDEQHIEGIIEDVVKMKVGAQTETALVVVEAPSKYDIISAADAHDSECYSQARAIPGASARQQLAVLPRPSVDPHDPNQPGEASGSCA